MTSDSSRTAPDVLVVGAGLIGLACAASAAERGFRVQLVGHTQNGQSSLAAAGLLAPSIERSEGPGSEFGIAARDRYPAYVAWLRDRTGIDVPLNRDGIIQVALNEAGVRGLRRGMPGDARWLDHADLVELEPALSHGLGGVIHADDGAVDNVRLFEALQTLVAAHPRITVADDIVAEMSFAPFVTAVGRSGTTYFSERAILCAGAWSSTIVGLPRELPVEPVRGQMISYDGVPLRRPVYGPTGYVVPRTSGRTLVGATMERAGFESVTTPDGIDRLRRTAAEIVPSFAHAAPAHAWAGLRPISRDLHPILGPDPDEPRLIYATGHSRNGVLMTPLTGDCIASVLLGEAPPADISPFSIGRFAESAR
ncbi:MAG TPA: FAD-dependent oxidoreductase [Gemmatimonadaceae bacterium]|nr:FAD-dependent oxidoreductase [Gemmatimonadaceae bacterium]